MEYKVIPTVFENAYEPRPIRPVYEPTQIVRTVVKEVEKPVERVVEVEKPVDRVVERIIEKPNDDNKEFIKKLDKLEDKIKDIYKKKQEPKKPASLEDLDADLMNYTAARGGEDAAMGAEPAAAATGE